MHSFVRSAVYERQFLRHNRWDVAVIFWLPLLTIVLVWWIFSRAYIVDLPIGVVAYDHSEPASTLIRYLDASPELSVHQLYPSEAAASQAMLARDIYGVVVIPNDFNQHIQQSLASPVTLLVNAQYGTHSGIVQKGVQSVVGTLSAGVEIQRLVKQGVAPEQAKIQYSPISVQRISLFNTGTDYQQFLASTVIPALLHILAMVIGATTIGRELRDKHLGVWYQRLLGNADTSHPQSDATRTHSTTSTSSSTLSDSTFASSSIAPTNTPPAYNIPSAYSGNFWVLLSGLLGKYLWAMLAFAFWGAVMLLLAISSHSSSTGSWWLTYATFLLLTMLSFWLGAFFTLGSYSLRMGLSATGFVSAPSFAFAGVTFPYIAISDKAKYWSDALPLTHYLKLHIAQLQMGAPVWVSLPIFYGFILAVVISLLLCTWLCRRALANPQRWGER